jgi:cell division cycle protein 37
MERQQRKHQIETLKYERIINDELKKRLNVLQNYLVQHEPEVESGAAKPAEVAFKSVLATQPKDPKDDTPPARPDGVHEKEEPLPSYTKMMMTVLDRVNEALKGKELEGMARYHAIIGEVKKHVEEVEKLQENLVGKLEELEKEEKKKITSESYHTGFDSSHVAKPTPEEKKAAASSSGPELLNPGYESSKRADPSTELEFKTAADANDDDEAVEASADAKAFARIKRGNYSESLGFLSKHPHIVAEKETDGLLVEAFDAALQGESQVSLQYVHQALLLQYCRALGRDGISLFFKRVSVEGKARDMFTQDVKDTHTKIQTRAAEIAKQRAAEGQAGVEQIQLHAVEPGTTIAIRIPDANDASEEGKKKREIFDSFSAEMKKALETGSLDEVNKVLGEMPCEEAEQVVSLLSEVSFFHRFYYSWAEDANDHPFCSGGLLECRRTAHRCNDGGGAEGAEGDAGGSQGGG